ncbi:hypothetical protein LTR62_000624 [Meristemomyces frigidus]|uniref:MFS general substrate transporter n=1 Tax=Meristemomyces frigidus TaxID=1508187 RepID=A0AAN7THL6_9PEZI|nr:hypothetical protein LTR62_000624 [Meristemomyces frigidus]
MPDAIPEKSAATDNVDSPPHSLGGMEAEIPSGWMYRSRKIGGITLPWYASPFSQLLLVAFVCFLCPGMFNALGGLGGGGQLNAHAADGSNTALNATFAIVAFFAGTITNKLGIRLSLSFGGLGYCIYVASYLCYNHTQNYGFMIFAGVLLGACAGILWAAQGAIMMSYPEEKNKGRYISVFWGIFNLGGVIGSLIPLGENLHVKTNSSVTDGTYVGFLVLTFLGACVAWTLTDASKVVRKDGSRVILMQHPTWKTEFVGLWQTLRSDPYIMLLWPMFFASNWFYTYQFNDVNLAQFNTRTRALNNTLYWSSQIVGAAIFGVALDSKWLSRPARAKAAWGALFVITMAIWGGGYAFQKQYTRAESTAKDYVKKDWTTDGYVGPMFLFMFYGFYDAAWQTCIYWFMGAMTNNSRKLANFAGFYKGIQSAGAAIIWRLDGLSNAPPYMNLFASCWGLLAGGLVIALPVIIMKIKDTVPIEEDVKFSDETVQDVIGHKSHVVPELEKV